MCRDWRSSLGPNFLSPPRENPALVLQTNGAARGRAAPARGPLGRQVSPQSQPGLRICQGLGPALHCICLAAGGHEVLESCGHSVKCLGPCFCPLRARGTRLRQGQADARALCRCEAASGCSRRLLSPRRTQKRGPHCCHPVLHPPPQRCYLPGHHGHKAGVSVATGQGRQVTALGGQARKEKHSGPRRSPCSAPLAAPAQGCTWLPAGETPAQVC